ncbi:2-phosphosulfolactate phosphatase family protein [Pseudothermotoga thermarum]|uniref:Probable 2-phosphosulfolactate phosphatase n=1 Tax=Pseudothermotoga thermarum DSM 5069 TaxID=688269 RepID=F7YX27_9THEM|nr:2-phosphosulfolactate phosphatase family protein [Pseudothermotoga thermarum]AEH50668.1 2-phosphosulfolactate phosphatase [Pseudothermotoga thermarum DSM 5069]
MIDVLFTPSRISTQACVVIVDVLRATSTIITALANGALSVKPVVEVSKALKERNKDVLVCGERNSVKPKGFDLGNSPKEYKREIVEGKNIILTTTNGTKAVNRVKSPKILAGAFLNLGSLVEKLRGCEDVLVVCAGQDGFIALEDVLCAGTIVERLKRDDLEDGAKIALQIWKDLSNVDLSSLLLSTSHGRKLAEIGMKDDVIYCSQIDLFDVVPILSKGKFIKYAE